MIRIERPKTSDRERRAKPMMDAPDPVPRAFLNVEQSVTGQRWVARLDQAGLNRSLAIAQVHGLPELVARVLAGRGVVQDDALRFLDPTIRDLMPDPRSLTDCAKAAARIAGAIERREQVAIFGDYDCRRRLGLGADVPASRPFSAWMPHLYSDGSSRAMAPIGGDQPADR